jgi:hypothetical protein
MPYRLGRPRRGVYRHLVDDAQALVAPFSSLGSFRPFANTEFETWPARLRQNERIDEVAAGRRSLSEGLSPARVHARAVRRSGLRVRRRWG